MTGDGPSSTGIKRRTRESAVDERRIKIKKPLQPLTSEWMKGESHTLALAVLIEGL